MRKKTFAAAAVLGGLLVLPATPALALNILMCNDDSLAAANLRAVKQRLVAAGHKVVAGVPLDNQSGKGGAIDFLKAIPAVTGRERGALFLGLAAGAPPVGPDPADPDVHYVNASPISACLYGIDVLAPAAFGGAPDLVISGPNEGSNTGLLNLSSGTVSSMLTAVNRELPAIAFSDAVSTQVTWSPSLPDTHRAFEMGDIVVRVVDTLVAQRAKAGGKLLPGGLGLNINVPKFAAGKVGEQKFAITRVGRATDYVPAFFERLSDSRLMKLYYGSLATPVPGVSIDVAGTVLPTGVVLPTDADPNSEQNKLNAGFITISPLEGVPLARRAFEDAVKIKLGGLVQ
jgi:5'-nucleotidase